MNSIDFNLQDLLDIISVVNKLNAKKESRPEGTSGTRLFLQELEAARNKPEVIDAAVQQMNSEDKVPAGKDTIKNRFEKCAQEGCNKMGNYFVDGKYWCEDHKPSEPVNTWIKTLIDHAYGLNGR